jgi:hypothetical protein
MSALVDVELLQLVHDLSLSRLTVLLHSSGSP